MNEYVFTILVWFHSLSDGTLIEPFLLFGGTWSPPMWLQSDRLLGP